jgi:GNAT superfamily N-acetyltransferase
MIHFQLLTQHPNFIPLIQETVWQIWQESIMHEYKVTQETFRITPSHYYIVLDTDTLVAFAAVDTYDLPSLYPDYTPWLADLFVFPAYRHQNVATNLIHFISN